MKRVQRPDAIAHDRFEIAVLLLEVVVPKKHALHPHNPAL
jgi:hypothetical protein